MPELVHVDDALTLLAELGAPPHLVQHHRLVAEAAVELCEGLHGVPLTGFEVQQVLLGAALHDVGKIVHSNEMHGGGSAHELTGRRLLREHGVPESIARHAWLHANWGEQTEPEPLVVALADTLWKGKRLPDLEERAIRALADRQGCAFWDVFAAATDVFERVASAGDARLRRSTQAE